MIAGALHSRDAYERATLALRSAPFLLILLVGFALFPVGSPRHWAWFAAAVVAAVLAGAVAVSAPWQRLPDVLAVTPALLVVVSIVFLRQGQGGGSSGYSSLFLVPTLWVACYGTRTQLFAALGAVVLAFWLPIVAIGGHAYPPSQWRGGGLLVLVVAFFGLVIQQLIGTLLAEQALRLAAERELGESRAYEIHDDVVQALTTAQLALAVDDQRRAAVAIERALTVAQSIVRDMLATRAAPAPGSFVREPREDELRRTG